MELSAECIRVELPNGAIAFVEATPLSSTETDVGEGDSLVDKFPLSDISGALEGIAALVTEAFIKVKPKKATLELGVKVGFEAGHLTAIIVKGTGEANLKIGLEW